MTNASALALFNGSYLSNRPTGIGVVARELANELDSNLIKLLAPKGFFPSQSILIPSGLTPEYGRRGHLRRLLWTQNILPRLINRLGVKYLLSPLPEAPVLRGVRSVVLAHDLIPLRYPQLTPLLAYHLTYVPLVLHRAVKVLCNSEATAKEVHCRMGISAKKLITIPLGVNTDKLFPLRLLREPFFLVLGRHDPHKNIARVLKALSLLRDRDIGLRIVGPHDNRYTPKLMKLAQEIGISHRCSWISWVSDEEKLKLLNTCQALVVASLWEGFGLPALEAMACHTPVLASTAGSLPEVVGNAAFLVDPKNAKSIADGMNQILVDRSFRKTFANNCEERLNLYTWERSARMIESVLHDL